MAFIFFIAFYTSIFFFVALEGSAAAKKYWHMYMYIQRLYCHLHIYAERTQTFFKESQLHCAIKCIQWLLLLYVRLHILCSCKTFYTYTITYIYVCIYYIYVYDICLIFQVECCKILH